jgi:hypothetical protein
MIRPEDQMRWRPWLLAGERLLWAGRPKRGLALRWADLYLVPLSLLWCAVTFGLHGGVRIAESDFSSPWLAIPLAALGLYLLAGRFLFDAFLRSRTFYAVTDHRVLILRAGPSGGLRSIDIEYLPLLELSEDRGPRGTIVFDPGEDSGPWGEDGLQALHPALRKGARFYRIEQPRLVYDLVQREAARRRREIAGELPANRAFIG